MSYRCHAFLLCLIVQNSAAQTFSAEGSLELEKLDSPNSNLDNEQTTFAATYHFKPVITNQGPLQEAPFIQRSSNIRLLYTQRQLDDGTQTIADDDNTQVAVRYIEPASGWLVEGSYAKGNGGQEFSPFLTSAVDTELYGLTFGKYLFKTTTLTLGYLRSDIEQSTDSTITCGSPFCPASTLTSTFTTEIDADTYSLDLRHLTELGRFAVQWRAGYSETETDTKFIPPGAVFFTGNPITPIDPPFSFGGFTASDDEPFLGFIVSDAAAPFATSTSQDASELYTGLTFYPTSNLGISFDYGKADNGLFDTERYQLALQWFIVPQIALRATYTELHAQQPSPTAFAPLSATNNHDAENFALGVIARF